MSSAQQTSGFAPDAVRYGVSLENISTGSYYALAGSGGAPAPSGGIVSLNGANNSAIFLSSATGTVTFSTLNNSTISIDATPSTVGVTSITSTDGTVTVTPGAGGVVDLTIPSAEPQFAALPIYPDFGTGQQGGLLIKSSTITAAVGPTTNILSFSTVVGTNYSFGYNMFISGRGQIAQVPISANNSAVITPTWTHTTSPGGAGSNAGLVRGQTIAINTIGNVTNAAGNTGVWIQAGNGIFTALSTNATFSVAVADPAVTGSGSQTGDLFTPSSIMLLGTQAGNIPLTYAYVQPLGNVV